MAKNKSNIYFWIFLVVVAALFGYLFGLRQSGQLLLGFEKLNAGYDQPLRLLRPNGGEKLTIGLGSKIQFKFQAKPLDGTKVIAWLLKGSLTAKTPPVTLGFVSSAFLTDTYVRDHGYNLNWTNGHYFNPLTGKELVAPSGSDYIINIFSETSGGTSGIDVSDNVFSLVR